MIFVVPIKRKNKYRNTLYPSHQWEQGRNGTVVSALGADLRRWGECVTGSSPASSTSFFTNWILRYRIMTTMIWFNQHYFSPIDYCGIVSGLRQYDLIVSKFKVQTTYFPGYYSNMHNCMLKEWHAFFVRWPRQKSTIRKCLAGT